MIWFFPDLFESKFGSSDKSLKIIILIIQLLIYHVYSTSDIDTYGFLDVTKGPYNIDNTGKTDVTKELQGAITYGRLNFLVVYWN